MRAFDSLANLVSGQGELELSNTSGSTDEIRTAAFPGPSPDAGARVLNMQMPNTEKNAMPQLGNPGVYVPPPAPRSASPSHKQNPYAMENQLVRTSSPASRIARSPRLSQAAEVAMVRPDRRSSSAGSGGLRRGPAGPADIQLAPQPLNELQLRAPPPRRKMGFTTDQSHVHRDRTRSVYRGDAKSCNDPSGNTRSVRSCGREKSLGIPGTIGRFCHTRWQ